MILKYFYVKLFELKFLCSKLFEQKFLCRVSRCFNNFLSIHIAYYAHIYFVTTNYNFFIVCRGNECKKGMGNIVGAKGPGHLL